MPGPGCRAGGRARTGRSCWPGGPAGRASTSGKQEMLGQLLAVLGDQDRGLVIDGDDDRPPADVLASRQQPGDQAVRPLASGRTRDEPARDVARDGRGGQAGLGDRVDGHAAPAKRAEHAETARVHRVLADLQHQRRNAAVERHLAGSLLDTHVMQITLNRSTTAISSSVTAGTQASASGRISHRLAGRHSLIELPRGEQHHAEDQHGQPDRRPDRGAGVRRPPRAAGIARGARWRAGGPGRRPRPGCSRRPGAPGSAAIAARKLRSQRGG